MASIVVGFDLDMTLIDSRPGIRAVYEAISAETGVFIDTDAAVSRLGPPLSEELSLWFPDDQVAALADRFRELYKDLAIAPTLPMPGVHAAIEAVHAVGGMVVVVTAKYAPNARLHIDHLGLPVDEIVGWLWGAAKGEALTAHGAAIYVGDHLGDIKGARAAGATAVAVATGPISAEELREAAADVVLDDLTQFPAWFASYVDEQATSA